jgi:hypothetical protein
MLYPVWMNTSRITGQADVASRTMEGHMVVPNFWGPSHGAEYGEHLSYLTYPGFLLLSTDTYLLSA